MYTIKYRWLSHMLEKKYFFQPLVPLCQICGSNGSVIKISNGPQSSKMEILFKDGKKSWILNEVQGLQQQLLSSLLSCNAFHLTPPTCFDSCFSKCVLLQNVTMSHCQDHMFTHTNRFRWLLWGRLCFTWSHPHAPMISFWCKFPNFPTKIKWGPFFFFLGLTSNFPNIGGQLS